MMEPILRVNVQNQMYYEDLSLVQMFSVNEHSRYLFLEFIKSFSLVLVGNQGSYDLHIFRLTNTGSQAEQGENIKMQREYVFKCPRWRERILGVSVVDNFTDNEAEQVRTGSYMQNTCRVYILTSDARIHVLEIKRRSTVLSTAKNTVKKKHKTRDGTVKHLIRHKTTSDKIMSVADMIY